MEERDKERFLTAFEGLSVGSLSVVWTVKTSASSRARTITVKVRPTSEEPDIDAVGGSYDPKVPQVLDRDLPQDWDLDSSRPVSEVKVAIDSQGENDAVEDEGREPHQEVEDGGFAVGSSREAIGKTRLFNQDLGEEQRCSRVAERENRWDPIE